jgi:hypothetical protein
MPAANSIYVLLMLYWGGSGSGQGFIATQEFSSQATCEQALAVADKKFQSWSGKGFTAFCSPK